MSVEPSADQFADGFDSAAGESAAAPSCNSRHSLQGREYIGDGFVLRHFRKKTHALKVERKVSQLLATGREPFRVQEAHGLREIVVAAHMAKHGAMPARNDLRHRWTST